MDSKRPDTVLVADTPAQRKALASPIRQEILGHFAGAASLSVTELAERMGRPATALYYHVSQLEDLGFLETAGERRKGKRYEHLYRPTAERFEIAAPGNPAAHEDAIKAIEGAQRMAIADMRDALESGDAREEGPDRNLIAFRLQGQLDPDTLAQVNEHIDAILDMASRSCRDAASSDDAEFISLTLALMPLKGRKSRRSK